MTYKKRLIPAFILLATATMAAPALADHHGDRGEKLKALDTDGDGAISRQEADAPRLERFASIDTNGDGALTQDEMEAARAQRKAERRAARFAKADTDGNGTISIDEYRAERASKRFDRLDANDDGLISAEEIDAAAEKRGNREGRRRGPRGS